MSVAAPPLPKGKQDAAPSGKQFENEYVSFLIGKQLLGVPVNTVQEVLNPQKIARTPKARPEIAGLLNLRGQIVTAVDLRKRLTLPPLEADRQSMNVVVRYKGESFSLLVDEVGEVINVESEKMGEIPHTLDSRWKNVTRGVFRLENRLFVILDVGAILQFDN
jgi:purine-binding chemotaxis protein CheW